MHDQQNKQKIANWTKGKLSRFVSLSRPFTRPHKRIVSHYFRVVFTRAIFSFPCTLVSMQSIKNVRRVTLVEKFTAKGNWAEKLILTLSDAFCLNFCPCSGLKLRSALPVQLGFIFGHFDAKHVACFFGLPFALSGRNLVRAAFLLFRALFACTFRNRLFSFYSFFFVPPSFLLWRFCCVNFQCYARHTKQSAYGNNKRIEPERGNWMPTIRWGVCSTIRMPFFALCGTEKPISHKEQRSKSFEWLQLFYCTKFKQFSTGIIKCRES